MFDIREQRPQNASFDGRLFYTFWRKSVQKLFPSASPAFCFKEITPVLHTVLASAGHYKTSQNPRNMRLFLHFPSVFPLFADTIIFNNFLMYNSVNKGESHEH